MLYALSLSNFALSFTGSPYAVINLCGAFFLLGLAVGDTITNVVTKRYGRKLSKE